uniref:Uncharacterized protein n=1 Tax=Cacopsylla melanoneura TaxID=428564 RepID=A0A8D8VRW5_9HEMI
MRGWALQWVERRKSARPIYRSSQERRGRVRCCPSTEEASLPSFQNVRSMNEAGLTRTICTGLRGKVRSPVSTVSYTPTSFWTPVLSFFLILFTSVRFQHVKFTFWSAVLSHLILFDYFCPTLTCKIAANMPQGPRVGYPLRLR